MEGRPRTVDTPTGDLHHMLPCSAVGTVGSDSAPVTALDEARRQAEEALATVAMRYPNGWDRYDTLSVCTSSLRSLLAATADLAEGLATAERERDEAQGEVARLVALTQDWYEGRARIGAHMTFVDQRFYDGVRCKWTSWPGDDADGDGGPPEE